MTKRTQASNPADGIVLHALAASIPDGAGAVEEWVTLFDQLGEIQTRDGRTYVIDGDALVARFDAEGIDLPVDVNHATDLAAVTGARSDAVGWISKLAIQNGKLRGRWTLLDEGKALLAAKKYRYLSPSFQADKQRRSLRLMAVALVTAPALASQTALAAAQTPQPTPEPVMKSVALALGLKDDASEAECLSAITTKVTGMVAKDVHDAALLQLNTASAELAALKASARKDKVDGVISAALSAKKILPAEKDHYIALCASDDGLASVEKLFAAKTALLAASDLDDRQTSGSAGDGQDAQSLADAALKIQNDRLAAGGTISFAEAMTLATRAK